MNTTVEVFADITCPFTHVGLKRVIEHVSILDHPVDVVVRAWPLEWVNGSALDVDPVQVKAAALSEQLGVDDFAGLRPDHWPSTTLPALELAAAAYGVDAATGMAVSLALRVALFEQGRDVGDLNVLAEIAAEHGVTPHDESIAVRADYEDGLARGVSGSPHFWVGDTNFFCPALDLGHDAENHLTARFDPDSLAQFFATIDD